MMADQQKVEEKKESLMEKITDKIDGHDSSSDSENEKKKTTSLKDKVSRLFGREKPVHNVLGGAADVFLWRNKKVSASVLGGATAIWVLFDVLEYHLLTLLCHAFMLGFSILFVWSNATALINKSPPHIPEVVIPEEPVLKFVSDLRKYINCGFATLKDIASGKELKKFLSVIAGLWVLSVLGSCTDFLTLLYTITVALFTLPLFYEKYEHQVDSFAEKALDVLKKQYAVFDEKVLSKIPRGPLKAKKRD